MRLLGAVMNIQTNRILYVPTTMSTTRKTLIIGGSAYDASLHDHDRMRRDHGACGFCEDGRSMKKL
jgi:hypothetical protein